MPSKLLLAGRRITYIFTYVRFSAELGNDDGGAKCARTHCVHAQHWAHALQQPFMCVSAYRQRRHPTRCIRTCVRMRTLAFCRGRRCNGGSWLGVGSGSICRAQRATASRALGARGARCDHSRAPARVQRGWRPLGPGLRILRTYALCALVHKRMRKYNGRLNTRECARVHMCACDDSRPPRLNTTSLQFIFSAVRAPTLPCVLARLGRAPGHNTYVHTRRARTAHARTHTRTHAPHTLSFQAMLKQSGEE